MDEFSTSKNAKESLQIWLAISAIINVVQIQFNNAREAAQQKVTPFLSSFSTSLLNVKKVVLMKYGFCSLSNETKI